MIDARKHLEKAEKYLQKGKSEDALEEYLAALKLEPTNNAALQNAADIAVSLKRDRDAEVLLSQLFDRCWERIDTTRGIATFRKLTKVAGITPLQTFRYAHLLERAGNGRQAVEPYKSALGGFEQQRRKDEALQCMNRIVALEPTAGNFRRAADLALELSKSALAAGYLRSAGELELREDGGLELLERAYVLEKENLSGALLYAAALLKAEDYPRAAEVLDRFREEARGNAEFTALYAKVTMRSGRPSDAYPLVWKEFEADPRRIGELFDLIRLFFAKGGDTQAVLALRRLQDFEERHGRRSEFISRVRFFANEVPSSVPFVEYLCELYNGSNLESDYSQALSRLFELRYAADNFTGAADALDAALQLDAYEAAHAGRLERLQGRIPPVRLQGLRSQLQGTVPAAPAAADPVPEAEPSAEPTGSGPGELEDFILQAEIFLQYSLRSKALDRIQQIAKKFPGEELKNARLMALYQAADFVPPASPVPAPTPASPALPAANVNATGSFPPANAFEFERIAEIGRNLQRQSNAKAVLLTAANEAGHLWKASRCFAALCLPGERPSAAVEYCAPGISQSSPSALFRLIAELQQHAESRGSIACEDAAATAELEPARQSIAALGIRSLLAVPLTDGDSQIGILILEQCDAKRSWRSVDVTAARTIADQAAFAVNNLRLRSLVRSLDIADERSGLIRRSSYLDVVVSEIGRALRQKNSVTIMLLAFDVHVQKQRLGHAQLQSAMDQVTRAILPLVRENDVAVDYAETSMAVILTDGGTKFAQQVLEKVRRTVRGVRLAGVSAEVEVQAGIAEAWLNPEFDPADIATEWINRAESALESARKSPLKSHTLLPQDSGWLAALASA